MAAAPYFKVYTAEGDYEAAAHSLETAAAIVTFLGDGATIRNGHRQRHIIWTEGSEDMPASESYDYVRETAADRMQAAINAARSYVTSAQASR